MTFDEYNTDETYNRSDSTADELIRLAKEEGKAKEALNLSSKWSEDRNGNVQKAIDKYYPAEEEKKEEEPAKVETRTEEKPAETTPAQTSTLNDTDKNFVNRSDAIADNGEAREQAKQTDEEQTRWNKTMDRLQAQGEAFNRVDDNYMDNLPNFILKDYLDGKFGDPKSADAKTRLAYFTVDKLRASLRNASNAAAMAAGKSPLYSDTQSDYDKIRSTNMYKGLENHWKKNEESTAAAMELAKKQGIAEQDLQNSITNLSTSARLQSRFNMMNEQQKAYTLEVMARIGNRISDMDNKEFINTLIGYAMSGDTIQPTEFAEILVGRYGGKHSDQIEAGFDKLSTALTGGNKDDGKGKNNLEGVLDANSNSDYGFAMDKAELADLQNKASEIMKAYADGKIDEKAFREQYGKFEDEMNKHWVTKTFVGKIKSTEDALKEAQSYKITDRISDKKTTKKDAEAAVNFFNTHPELIETLKQYPTTEYSERNKESYKFWADKKNLAKYGFKSTKDVNKALDYLLTLQKNPKLNELVKIAKEEK